MNNAYFDPLWEVRKYYFAFVASHDELYREVLEVSVCPFSVCPYSDHSTFDVVSSLWCASWEFVGPRTTSEVMQSVG